jgi:uridine kinase
MRGRPRRRPSSATDLGLLRRIVRDRHGRGYSAAENIARWPSVLAGERTHIYPDHVPPTSLIRESIGGSGFEY